VRTGDSEPDVDLQVREARADDYDAVVAFTRDTWSDRETGDYLPDVFHDWLCAESAETSQKRSGTSATAHTAGRGSRSSRISFSRRT